MARSLAREDAGPSWVTARWRWGPGRWPLHWCEAVRRTELDCGALAHLAEAARQEVGQSVARVQLIESHSAEQCAQWAARWQFVPEAPPWIWGDLVYHEAVAIPAGKCIRLWDSTSGCWLEGGRSPNGRILAIRLLAEAEAETSFPQVFHWDAHRLPVGIWQRLEADRPQGR